MYLTLKKAIELDLGEEVEALFVGPDYSLELTESFCQAMPGMTVESWDILAHGLLRPTWLARYWEETDSAYLLHRDGLIPLWGAYFDKKTLNGTTEDTQAWAGLMTVVVAKKVEHALQKAMIFSSITCN